MISLQFHGSIYYRVYKDVAPGKELLVGCEEEYPIELGIALGPGSSDRTSSADDTDEETDDRSIFTPSNF